MPMSRSSTAKSDKKTRELKTARGRLTLLQQHLYNGLARRADYSIFCT